MVCALTWTSEEEVHTDTTRGWRHSVYYGRFRPQYYKQVNNQSHAPAVDTFRKDHLCNSSNLKHAVTFLTESDTYCSPQHASDHYTTSGPLQNRRLVPSSEDDPWKMFLEWSRNHERSLAQMHTAGVIKWRQSSTRLPMITASLSSQKTS